MRLKLAIIAFSLIFAGSAFGQSFDVFNGGRGHWWSPGDVNEVTIRTGSSAEETYQMKWPINSGDPNSVLMTPGDADSQLVWGTVDANIVIVDPNDPNVVIIGLPEKTPWNVTFVDANGFPIYDDPNDFTYYQPERAFGIGMDSVTGRTYADNLIEVYSLLLFDPNTFNTSIGWGGDNTTLTGPNNVRIGYGAGPLLREGYQNALGGKDSGYGLIDEADNAFWGYQSGVNIKAPPVRSEAYVAANGTSVLWWDEDWTLLDEENLGGGNICCSVEVDSTGIVVAGFGKVGSQAYCVRRWDLDLNASDTFYVPDSGWGGIGTWVGDLSFTSDDAYLYVCGKRAADIQGTLWKFDAVTGEMLWEYNITAPYYEGKWMVHAIEGNADGHFFNTSTDGGNGANFRSGIDYTWWYGFRCLLYGFDYDNVNGRTYSAGNIALYGDYWHINAIDYDGSNANLWAAGDTISNVWNVRFVDGYVYAAGSRIGNKSVWKLDSELALIDSYDTGNNAWDIIVDWDDNLAVFSHKITILDTDLNLITEHAIGTTVNNTFGNEIKRIPHQSAARAFGSRNTAIGSQALAGASAGAEPNEASAGGYKSMFNVSAGDLSTGWGAWSLYTLDTGDRDVALGPYAGFHLTTEDDKFVVDSRMRTNAADEIVSSILFGHMADDANDQWLNINADVNMMSLTLSDLTASRLVATDADKTLVSSDVVNWIAGTVNQIVVTDDSDGTATLSADDPFIVDQFVADDIKLVGNMGALLLETGGYLLLESGGKLLLESFEFDDSILYVDNDGFIQMDTKFTWDEDASELALDGATLTYSAPFFTIKAPVITCDVVSDLNIGIGFADADYGLVFNGDDTTGVLRWDESAGTLSMWCTGGSNNNDILFDLETTDNQVAIGTATGVTTWDWSGLNFTGLGAVTATDLTVTNSAVLGSDSAVFQPNADVVEFFKVKDQDGNTIINIDTVNNTVAIGSDTGEFRLDISGVAYNALGTGVAEMPIVAIRSFSSTYADWQANPGFYVFKSHHNTVGTLAETINNELLGEFVFSGVSGTDAWSTAATIQVAQDGAAGSGGAWRVPAEMMFYISTGSGTSIRLLALKKSGNVGFQEKNPETQIEMTSVAPYLTLHNNTHEDADGGGEVRIIGKREDGSGTETAAGQIEIAHDGAGADDQLGKIVEYVNTGAGLVQVRESGSDLLTTFAGGVTVKGLSVNIVAKTAAYTATVTDDVITCGAGNETFTIDLPAVSEGKTYYIKNVGTGVITVDADTTGSTTIDGDTTQTINQYECLKVVADASVYWAI